MSRKDELKAADALIQANQAFIDGIIGDFSKKMGQGDAQPYNVSNMITGDAVVLSGDKVAERAKSELDRLMAARSRAQVDKLRNGQKAIDAEVVFVSPTKNIQEPISAQERSAQEVDDTKESEPIDVQEFDDTKESEPIDAQKVDDTKESEPIDAQEVDDIKEPVGAQEFVNVKEPNVQDLVNAQELNAQEFNAQEPSTQEFVGGQEFNRGKNELSLTELVASRKNSAGDVQNRDDLIKNSEYVGDESGDVTEANYSDKYGLTSAESFDESQFSNESQLNQEAPTSNKISEVDATQTEDAGSAHITGISAKELEEAGFVQGGGEIVIDAIESHSNDEERLAGQDDLSFDNAAPEFNGNYNEDSNNKTYDENTEAKTGSEDYAAKSYEEESVDKTGSEDYAAKSYEEESVDKTGSEDYAAKSYEEESEIKTDEENVEPYASKQSQSGGTTVISGADLMAEIEAIKKANADMFSKNDEIVVEKFDNETDDF